MKRINIKKILFSLLIGLMVLFLFEDGLVLYNKFRGNKTIFNQLLNNLNVSQLTKKQTIAFIKYRYDRDIPLRLSYKNKMFEVRKKDIGAKIDYQSTLDQLNKKGRKNNLFQNIVEQNLALFGLTNIKVKGNVSKTLLVVKVLDISDQINREPQPSMPNFSGDWNKILPQKNGIKVDSSTLSELIANNIFTPQNKPISIPVKIIERHYEPIDMNKIRKEAAESIAQPISIISAGIKFTLTSDDLKSLLTLTEDADPTNPKKTIVNIGLDRTKLNHKLDNFAEKVQKLTNNEFNHHDARPAIYSQFYTNTRRLVEVSIGSKRDTNVLGTSTQNGDKSIFLTFDDGPNIVYHPLLLDILKEKEVKATFYFVGANSKQYSSTTQRTIREGHAIADHSLTHAFLPKLLKNQIYDEIKTTRDILNSFLGKNNQITLFRPPYGGINDSVWQYAKDLGLSVNYWTVDPRDWSDPPTNELIDRVVKETKDGSIILLHSNHFSTVKALPIIIDKLKEKGFQFKLQS